MVNPTIRLAVILPISFVVQFNGMSSALNYMQLVGEQCGSFYTCNTLLQQPVKYCETYYTDDGPIQNIRAKCWVTWSVSYSGSKMMKSNLCILNCNGKGTALHCTKQNNQHYFHSYTSTTLHKIVISYLYSLSKRRFYDPEMLCRMFWKITWR